MVSRLAVHRDVFALVALGEVGDGRVRRWLRFGTGGWPSLMRAMTSVAFLRAWSTEKPVPPWVPRLTRFERPKARVWTTKTFLPEGYTRTPKPVSSLSQKTASLPLTARRSTVRLVRVRYWRSAMVRRLLRGGFCAAISVADP